MRSDWRAYFPGWIGRTIIVAMLGLIVLVRALHRLEQQGWLKGQAGRTETGRDGKFYALTAAGRRQLARELESWDRLSTAIGLVVREAE